MVAETGSGRKMWIPPAVFAAAVRGEVKGVLLQLWRFAPYQRAKGAQCFVYPSVSTLASELQTTMRSVYRSIARLIEMGFVERATQTIVRHSRGQPDREVTVAGFVLFDEPIGRKETATGEEIEVAHQLEMWGVLPATDGSVTDSGPKCHSASSSDLRSDLDDFVVTGARAPAPARVAHGVPRTTTDDDGDVSTTGDPYPSRATGDVRTTSTHAGTTTTTKPIVRHSAPIATPAPADSPRPPPSRERTETTPPPGSAPPPPPRQRPLALWERHEKLRCAAKVGGPHRDPPTGATLSCVVKLRDHVRTKLECDEETAWRVLDCYVRGAVRLVVEARDANRTCTPMLANARCDGREWSTDRFDKTWPHVERVEWKAETKARMVDAEKARTDALLSERRAWENDPDRITPDRMHEVGRDLLGPMGLNRWKVGVAAGAVAHETPRGIDPRDQEVA